MALVVGIVGGVLTATVIGRDAVPTPVDVGFAQDLTVREMAAAEIARVAAANTEDPEIRSIAFDIASTRQNRVGYLQGWLFLWEQPTLPLGRNLAWMDGDGVDAMPGLPSSAERAELRQSRGRESDVLFLTLMRDLDRGGLDMLSYAADHADVGAVRELAATTATQQQHQADVLEQLLTARTSADHN